jgi:AraC-like DNA-binding protein
VLGATPDHPLEAQEKPNRSALESSTSSASAPGEATEPASGCQVWAYTRKVRPSITAVVPYLVASSAREAGFDPERLLKATGIELDVPPSADDHVDIERYYELWRRTMDLVRDPAFPLHAASAFQLEDNEVFGFLAMSCETLGEAYDRTAAVRAIYNIGARWELQIDSDAARMIWYPWPGDARDPGYRAAMDFAMADMANSARRLGRAEPRPIAVRLAHGPPEDTSAHRRHYGVEPSFGAPLYELVYERGLREMPIRTFNSRLRDYFEEECRRLITELGLGSSVVARLRKNLIAAMDGGETSIGRMAKDLGMSPRSLQRRLSDEGTRYNDVLDDIRQELAKRYLARGTVSASEVAYLVGFVEPPAFFRAFKRWTGMTPRAFQQGR